MGILPSNVVHLPITLKYLEHSDLPPNNSENQLNIKSKHPKKSNEYLHLSVVLLAIQRASCAGRRVAILEVTGIRVGTLVALERVFSERRPARTQPERRRTQPERNQNAARTQSERVL